MRLTGAGVSVAVCGLVLLGGGWWTGYPELVLLGFGCAAALLFAAARTWAPIPDLTIERSVVPARPQEGQRVLATARITSPERRCPRLTLTDRVGERSVTHRVQALAPGESASVVFAFTADTRGRYQLGPLELSRRDPLGLMTSGPRSPKHGAQVLMVHPRWWPGVQTRAWSGGARDADGRTSASSPQGGVAFHSLRDYQPGDDPRLIHWRSTARRGAPVVRQMVIPDEPRHLVVLDADAQAVDAASFEVLVQAAASLCVAVSEAGLQLRLRVTGGPEEGEFAADRPLQRGGAAGTAALDRLATASRTESASGVGEFGGRGSEDEAVILTLFAGALSTQQAVWLETVAQRFMAVYLIQAGAGSSVPPRGILHAHVRDGKGFVASWNKLTSL